MSGSRKLPRKSWMPETLLNCEDSQVKVELGEQDLDDSGYLDMLAETALSRAQHREGNPTSTI